MFELALRYSSTDMSAYVALQEREFALEPDGYTATRHPPEVGAGYFDEVASPGGFDRDRAVRLTVSPGDRFPLDGRMRSVHCRIRHLWGGETMARTQSEHLRKNITGMCLIAAPLVLLAGQAFHPVDESGAADELRVVAGNLERWYTAHLILLLAAVLLIPAVLGLAHLIHERRPALAYSGGGLTLIGIVAISAVIGVDGIAGYFVASGAPDAATSVAFFDEAINNGRMLPLYLATLLLGIGLLVTAAALYRTRVIAPWSAIAIGLAGLAMDIGFPTGAVPVIWAAVVLLVLGMAPVGYSVLTESDADWAHTPDFAGFRHVAPTAT